MQTCAVLARAQHMHTHTQHTHIHTPPPGSHSDSHVRLQQTHLVAPPQPAIRLVGVAIEEGGEHIDMHHLNVAYLDGPVKHHPQAGIIH